MGKSRDRDATSRGIVDAVGRVLARDGFRGLGLRSVAREAGVDKRLLSRYFGDLNGLVTAYAAGSDFWWTVDELVGDHLPGPAENTWTAWLALAIRRHTRALRERELTREILAWELIEPNALTEELSAMRERRAAELVARIAAKVGTAADDSWREAAALLAAATTYLVVRARTCDFYLGIDLHAEDSWKRFDRAVDVLAGAPVTTAPKRTSAATASAVANTRVVRAEAGAGTRATKSRNGTETPRQKGPASAGRRKGR